MEKEVIVCQLIFGHDLFLLPYLVAQAERSGCTEATVKPVMLLGWFPPGAACFAAGALSR